MKPMSKYVASRMVIVGCFGLLDFYISGEIDILIYLVLALLYLSFDDVYGLIKDYTRISLFFFITTIILSYLHIVDSHDAVRMVDGVLINRSSLGFTNVNHVFSFFISIVLGIYIINEYKSKIKVASIILIASTLLYMVTNCRTGFFSVLVLVVLMFFEDFVFEKGNRIGYVLFILFTILSFAIGILWGSTPYNAVNEMLTNRPFAWFTHISSFPLSILGNPTAKVDNTYLWLIYRHGLIIYLFYLFMSIRSQRFFRNNKRLFISFVIISMYGIFENLLNYAFNVVFIMQIMVLLDKKLGLEEKNNYE